MPSPREVRGTLIPFTFRLVRKINALKISSKSVGIVSWLDNSRRLKTSDVIDCVYAPNAFENLNQAMQIRKHINPLKAFYNNHGF